MKKNQEEEKPNKDKNLVDKEMGPPRERVHYKRAGSPIYPERTWSIGQKKEI